MNTVKRNAWLCLPMAAFSSCAPAMNGYVQKTGSFGNAIYQGTIPYAELTEATPGGQLVRFPECRYYAVTAAEVRAAGVEQARAKCAKLQQPINGALTVIGVAVAGFVVLLTFWIIRIITLLSGRS